MNKIALRCQRGAVKDVFTTMTLISFEKDYLVSMANHNASTNQVEIGEWYGTYLSKREVIFGREADPLFESIEHDRELTKLLESF